MWCFLVLIAILTSAPALAKLPNYIQPCVRNSTDFDECMLDRIMVIMPHLEKGVPELDITSLEPLVLPMVNLQQGSDAVQLKLSVKNLNIRGLSMYLFRKFKLDLGPMPYATGTMWIPRVMLDGEYEIDGKLLLVPVQGKGHLYANGTNVNVDLSMGLQRKQINGKKYLDPIDVNLKMKFGDATIHLGNMSDNGQIGKVTEMFVKQNSKEFVEEIKPSLESVASMVVQDIVTRAFRSTPEDELFL